MIADHMSLLRSLRFWGVGGFYKHVAPNGAGGVTFDGGAIDGGVTADAVAIGSVAAGRDALSTYTAGRVAASFDGGLGIVTANSVITS